MKSLADSLPPEIARQVHPDWRKNEQGYWAAHDNLLPRYRGQWIAFADGAVVVAAPTPLEVFLAIQQSGQHPFVIRVGHENEPWYRIRRASFPYDTGYPSAALPVVSAERSCFPVAPRGFRSMAQGKAALMAALAAACRTGSASMASSRARASAAFWMASFAAVSEVKARTAERS